jgi:hypothetical protein
MSQSLTPLHHPELANHERQPCEVWTRVMGYHRPVASFNIGKKGEHAERQSFVVEADCRAPLSRAEPALMPAAVA